MTKIILQILNWIKITFFEKDIISPAPVQPITPITPPAPVAPPTPITTKLDLWCEYTKEHEGYFPGSPSYRNNNPGNLEFHGQPYSVLDPIGKRFAKFDTLEHGKHALWNLFYDACSGKSSNYQPDSNLFQFYEGIPKPNKYNKVIDGYSPSSDGNDSVTYANGAAKAMGVLPTLQIKYLIS